MLNGEARKRVLLQLKLQLDQHFANIKDWPWLALAFNSAIGGSGNQGVARYRKFNVVLEEAIQTPDAPGILTKVVNAAFNEGWAKNTHDMVMLPIFELLDININHYLSYRLIQPAPSRYVPFNSIYEGGYDETRHKEFADKLVKSYVQVLTQPGFREDVRTLEELIRARHSALFSGPN